MTGKNISQKNQTNLYGTLNMNDRDSALDNIMRFMDDEDDLDATYPFGSFYRRANRSRFEKLDSLQAALEHEISEYSLDRSKDIIQLEDEKDIYRVMIFSKGMNAYIVVFGSDGKMTAWDKNTPNELMAQIFNVTVALDLS